MEHSPALVFYTLNPNLIPADDKISGRVVDKVVISDPVAKQELIEATARALTQPPIATVARCFNPHHAVSTSDGCTSVVICFECGQAQIDPTSRRETVYVDRDARPLFDALARKYKLKTVD